MFYLKHNYTNILYFEKKVSWLNAIEDALKLAISEAKDGVDLEISAEFTINFFSYKRRKVEETGR